MTVNTDPNKQRREKGSQSDPASGFADTVEEFLTGGAMGFLNRAGDAMQERIEGLYTKQNLERVFDKLMDGLPAELRDGLKQLFNLVGGALDANAAPSREYQAIDETYGAGGSASDSVRMDSNFAQRDDDNFAAGVTIGNGTGGITEINGISYKNGKPVNDGNDDDTEYMESMGERSDREERDRERLWDQSKHSVAGMELSGEEIDSMIELMNDPAKRQKLIDRRAKEKGISSEQAEKEIDNARRYLELTKLRDTGKLTAEQEAEWQRLDKDSATREAVKAVNAESFDEKYGKPSKPEAANSQISKAGVVDSGASLLDAQFPTAPVLQEQFAEAKAAKVPLDAEKLRQPIAVASVERSAPPAQIASSGFDV